MPTNNLPPQVERSPSPGAAQRETVRDVHSFAAQRFDDLRELSGAQFWERVDGTDGAFALILEEMAPEATDTVLDVGSGAGLLACQLARYVSHVTGVDLVPEMLEAAQAMQRRAEVTNVTWQVVDVPPLPFDDGAFSIVTTRLCLHHTPDPLAVIAEMVRVCAPGGRVVLIDEIAPADPTAADRYNAWERTRDPSHERFLPAAEHIGALRRLGLVPREPRLFFRELDLDVVLENSFPRAGHAEAMQDLKRRARDDDSLLGLRTEGERWVFNTVDMVIRADKASAVGD